MNSRRWDYKPRAERAAANPSALETRLLGAPRMRFLQELFGNSAQFPIANILLELLLEGPADYMRAPDLYTITLAGLTQAYFLSRWQTTAHPRRFLGNLIGPALYTVVEAALEGPRFFNAPHHLAYWGFALVVGTLQTLRPHLPRTLAALALILEDMTRASILFVMYAIFEAATNPQQTTSFAAFFEDRSHQFVALVTLLLGLGIGLSSLTAQHYLALLRQTSAQLKTYSEWLLGRDLLGKAITDPGALTLTRRERTVLFMDIRGFTRWSEARSPEEVVTMLNRYYRVTEMILTAYPVIKFKFTADEAIAVFPTAVEAVSAARELTARVSQLLTAQNLGAGIGLHTGQVVEGLLGSAGVKFYDVIGDTVNTAKRIESAARAGQVLVSETTRAAIGETMRVGAPHQIAAKGKDAPLTVYTLNQ